MCLFVLFVSTGVFFDSPFSMWVSLSQEQWFSQKANKNEIASVRKRIRLWITDSFFSILGYGYYSKFLELLFWHNKIIILIFVSFLIIGSILYCFISYFDELWIHLLWTHVKWKVTSKASYFSSFLCYSVWNVIIGIVVRGQLFISQ